MRFTGRKPLSSANAHVVVAEEIPLELHVADTTPDGIEFVLAQRLPWKSEIAIIPDELTIQPPPADSVGRIRRGAIDHKPLDLMPRPQSDRYMGDIGREPDSRRSCELRVHSQFIGPAGRAVHRHENAALRVGEEVLDLIAVA